MGGGHMPKTNLVSKTIKVLFAKQPSKNITIKLTKYSTEYFMNIATINGVSFSDTISLYLNEAAHFKTTLKSLKIYKSILSD
jgi:hypothetical protein